MTHPAAFDPAHVADGTALPAYKPAAAVASPVPSDARKWIREIEFSLATAGRIVEPPEVGRALDAFRDQVLTEAAKLLVSEARRRYDAIDEYDRDPSDEEQYQQWLDAAHVLRAARSTTAQEG
jgi:hypothetical protein